MKKKLTAAIMSLMIAASQIPAMSAYAAETEVELTNILYVSQGAAEEGADGSFEKPFATIEAARDAMREKTLGADNRGIIYLREGVYRVSESIALTDADSYVTFSSYGGERVEITGSAHLKSEDFKPLSTVSGEQYAAQSRIQSAVKSKIFVYDLKAAGIPSGHIYKNGFNWKDRPLRPDFVVDEELQKLAQYPNDSSVLNTNQIGIADSGADPRSYFFDKNDNPKTYEEMLVMRGPVFTIKSTLPARAATWAAPYVTAWSDDANKTNQPELNPNNDITKYETDGWFSGYFGNSWGSDNVRMYSVKDNTNIYCKYPSLYKVVSGSLKASAINLLCEMDSEGEYYIDRFNDNDVLYYYPKGGTMEGKSATLTAFDKPLVTMDGATAIHFTDIMFTGTTNSGIVMMDCESCAFDGCEICNISMDAIRIGQNNGVMTGDPSYKTWGGGHNNSVENCSIHGMGYGGVYLSGGEAKSLDMGRNTVKNCEIYDNSRLRTYTPAVYLEGCGNSAEYNYIYNSPHMAMQIMGNNMKIAHNKFVNSCYNTNDMAPIYIGRNWTWLGNEIVYNYIDDVHYANSTHFNFGVYMDDNTGGVIIHHNIFNRVGGNAVYSNTGYGAYVTDNIIVDGTDEYYRFYTNGKRDWVRPIPNEKALKYRFFDITRTEEEAIASGDENNENTRGYWNTQENIDKWNAYYNALYNSLPEYSRKSEYKFDWSKKYFAPEGDATAQTWSDMNSIIAHAGFTITRNITVNTKDLWLNGGWYNNTMTGDTDKFDTKRYRASTPEEIGLDLKSGKIREDSPLSSSADYGEDWVEKWNDNFSLENVGIKSAQNNVRLAKKIAQAQDMLAEHPTLGSILPRAHAVSANALVSRAKVDAMYNELVAAMALIVPQYEFEESSLSMEIGDSAQLHVLNTAADDTIVWKSANSDIAVVDRDGVVCAVGSGDTEITAQINTASLVCSVNVAEQVVGDAKMTIDPSKVSASSQESSNMAKNVVDGSMTTRWSSKNSTGNGHFPQWLEIDLGEEIDVDKIGINFYYSGTAKNTDRSYAYYIYAKGENDSDYRVLLDQSTNTDKTSDVEFSFPDEQKARYLKLYVLSCGGKDKWAAISLFEFNVYQKISQGLSELYLDALDKEIAAAQRLDSAHFTSAAWTKVSEALAAAKALRDNPLVAQSAVNAAQSALYEATFDTLCVGINASYTTEGDKIKLSAAVLTAQSDTTDVLCLIATAFKDGTIADVKAVNAAVENHRANFETTIAKGDCVKVFAWDKGKLIPHFDVATIE